MGWFKPGSLQQIIAWRTGSDYGDAAPCNPERCLGGRVSRQHLALKRRQEGVSRGSHCLGHIYFHKPGAHTGGPQQGRVADLGGRDPGMRPLFLLGLVGRVVHPPLWQPIPLSGGPFPSPIRGTLIAESICGIGAFCAIETKQWQTEVKSPCALGPRVGA